MTRGRHGRQERKTERRGGTAPTRYQMREKLMSIGDGFSIEDGSGRRILKADGKALRWMMPILVVGLLLASAAGCGTSEPEPTLRPTEAVATAESAAQEIVATYPLAASAWDLDYFFTPEDPVSLLPDTRATVTYFWEKYAGFDGCNWLVGVYSATTDGEMHMYQPAKTRNICGPEEFQSQAASFGGSLLGVTAYQLDGEQLIESTVNDQRLLTFNPAKPVPMTNTKWGLSFWWDADGEQWWPAVPGSSTDVTFGAGGEASGSGGCNDYTVGYEGDLQVEKVIESTDTYAELPTLTFGAVAAQQAACEEPEGIMDQEQAYLSAFGSVAYYAKLGGILMMLDAEGIPLLVFGARN